MRVCIITSTNRRGSCDNTSVMVHCRNAKVLCEELGWDLIECEQDNHKLDEPYDHIICNYASFYMPWRAYFDRIMDRQPNARLWWMVNDHDVEDNILLRNILKATSCKRTYGVISNNSREGFRQWILRKWIEKDKVRLNDCIDQWHTVNLNALTFEDHNDEGMLPLEDEDLFIDDSHSIYWGSWRKWREPYFKKYSDNRIRFSTSPKNVIKLRNIGCQYDFIPKMRWGKNGTLLRYNATVYLEDPHTHDNFAFPANRFYEAISYGVNVGFDVSCKKNADQFGYDGIRYIDSPQELLSMAQDWEPIPQRWIAQAVIDRDKTLNQIEAIIS